MRPTNPRPFGVRLHPSSRALVALALLLGLGSCGNNVGRVFDRGGGSGGSTSSSSIQAPPDGGIVLNARPKVLQVGPSGSGIQSTTPVMVLFNESMNLASLRSSTTETPEHLYVRVKGATTALPGLYQLLLGGRLLVIRPQAPFASNRSYEIVAGKTVRDIDRATLQKQGVLAEFTTDGAADAPAKIVFRYPDDNDSQISREDPYLIAVSAPVDPKTVTSASFFVRRQSDQTKVAAGISYPVKISSADDPRIVQLKPNATLDPSTKYEFVFTEDIKVGSVKIDPGKKKPPVTFTTMAPTSVVKVRVGNPSVGYDDRVNLVNLAGLNVAVDVPTDAKKGDKVAVRVYGVDRNSKSNDLLFVESEATLSADGKSTLTVPMTGKLGTVTTPIFKDGALTLVARLARGTSITGFRRGPDSSQDTTRPSLVEIGPPAATGTNVFLTDLNATAVHGLASEELGGLELVIGATTYKLFAGSPDGRFLAQPFFLGRSTSPVGYTLRLFDKAGNPSASTSSGTIVQRGFLAGNVSSGSLTVVAYDEATLQGLAAATVLIEPGRPQKPASGRKSSVTDANGSTTFTGLTQSSYTITVVKSGYHLRSVINTSAGHVSLPVKPLAASAASLSGTVTFIPSGASTAKIGINVLEDESKDFIHETKATAPTTVQGAAVKPLRPLMVTAFQGVFPPTAKPTYANYAGALAASTGGLGSNKAPVKPLGGGKAYGLNLLLLPSLNSFVNLALPSAFSLASVQGIDSTKLASNPVVSVLVAYSGFGGMSLNGVGFSSGSGTAWTADASYSFTILTDLAGLGPVQWLSTQATDTSGNTTRLRALFSDLIAGLALPLTPVASVPTVTAPSASFTGSPVVVYADRLNSASVANTLAFHEVRATDKDGRQWFLLEADSDAATGTNSLQIPDLSGSGVTGLATGIWSILVADRWILAPGLSASDFNFADLDRFELTYARSKTENHSIQ